MTMKISNPLRRYASVTDILVYVYLVVMLVIGIHRLIAAFKEDGIITGLVCSGLTLAALFVTVSCVVLNTKWKMMLHDEEHEELRQAKAIVDDE